MPRSLTRYIPVTLTYNMLGNGGRSKFKNTDRGIQV